MCDYSIAANTKTRAAEKNDRLITHRFGHTKGFAPQSDPETAVCLLPGTELAFDAPIEKYGLMGATSTEQTVAIFEQVDKEQLHCYHDMLELPDGQKILLNDLTEGQTLRVLSLPVSPEKRAAWMEQVNADRTVTV